MGRGIDLGSQILSSDVGYMQSADSLFNFQTQLEYLLTILRERCFTPRYCRETTDYLNIRHLGRPLERIAFPMICFCDIKLHMIEAHTAFYGRYGLGLTKEWGEHNHVQPIQYINPHSAYADNIKKVFETSVSLLQRQEQSEELELLTDFFAKLLTLYKPLYGKMHRGEELVGKNFHDEKEWRYVPNTVNFPEEYDFLIIDPLIMNSKDAINALSNSIGQIEDIKLRFSLDDISYIFVESEKECERVWEAIDEMQCTDNEKKRLFSCIEVLDKIRKAW